MEETKGTKEQGLTGQEEDVETLSFILESEESRTEPHVKLSPEGTNDSQTSEKQREDQERTRIKKKLFFEHYERNKGIIELICKDIEIGRRTYYEWRDADPEFVANLEKLKENINDEVEDILMGLVKIKRDPSCVKFYLERLNPKYRMKQEIGGLGGMPLPPIQVEIVEPKHANTNTEKNTGDNSISKEQGKPEKNQGE